MSKTLMIKAMVLGAVACAFSATGFAADVQNGHGQGIADYTTEVNAAKYEAVRSNWMDRTDVVVGIGMKDSKETHSQHHYVGASSMRHDQHTVTSKNSKSTEINKLYIETLQPITHYDENAKSVVFVQGRIGRSGEKNFIL